MSFPRYESYKHSGIEWLGEVPEHWEISRLGFESWVRARLGWKGLKAEEYVDDGFVFLATPNIKGLNIDFENVNFINEYRYNESPEIQLRVGDVLLAKDGSTLGTVNIVRSLPRPTTVNSSIAVITPNKTLKGVYLYYLFQSSYMENTIQRIKGGMGVPHLFQEDLNKFYIPLPPIENQSIIVAFLDIETAKIDALIAEQQRLIELLKEKRQAIISHAVTKGLNPDAPMKDSGIEWLGDVPEHWDVKRLGVLSNLIQTGPFGSQLHSEDYVEDETPVINPSNIKDGQIIPDWSCTVGHKIVERLSHHKLMAGDIVFGRRGEMGRCARVSDKEVGWLCGTGSLNVRLNKYMVSEFVSIYLRTAYVREFLILESVGSTMDNLNTTILSRISLPAPPPAEQLAITIFLDRETAKLDALTTEAKNAITLLQERRTALISAAVTGKIDVRSLVAAQADMEQAA